MSVLKDTWGQLVRRKLWPVALLLVGALVAVPVMLSKDPQPTPAAPMPTGTKAQQAALAADANPIVALATADEARRRRVLGSSKDPFEPAPLKAVKPISTPDPVTFNAPIPEDTGAGSGLGGGSTPSIDVPVEPVPDETVPEVPKPVYPLYTLTVRFGLSESLTLPRSKVERLQALPDSDAPVLVYLGVLKGGKVAVFMVDHGTSAQGDGSCKPDADTCETIHLRIGDTEFFDVLGEDGKVAAQYQLDLVDIKVKTTASAAMARKAYAKSSKSGRRAFRARQASRPLRYSYDVRRGVVKRLGKPALKAAMAGGF